jgi:hypothetical protein
MFYPETNNPMYFLVAIMVYHMTHASSSIIGYWADDMNIYLTNKKDKVVAEYSLELMDGLLNREMTYSDAGEDIDQDRIFSSIYSSI